MKFSITSILICLLLAASIPGGVQAQATPAPTGQATQEATMSGTSSASASGKQIVAYFASWDVYGRNYHASHIPADKLTVINYAFANLVDGKCALGDPTVDIENLYPGDPLNGRALHGNFHQLQLVRAKNPGLGLSMSIGGWSWSSAFSKIAATDESRKTFVSSCVDMFINGNFPNYDPVKGVFDGIDIDWEFPVCCGKSDAGTDAYSPQDKHNFTLLMAEFRKQLDEQGAKDGKHYRLTIAAPATPKIYANIEMKALSDVLDWINVMAYDFYTAVDTTTNLSSPLYAPAGNPSPDPDVRNKFNADAAIQAYLAAGVPANKIVLGIPFYSHSWSGVPATNNGLYQPATGIPNGTWDDYTSGATGVYDYADIVKRWLPVYQRYWSKEAQVPWLYSPDKQIFITYEDPQSVGIKADYINAHNLGGAMIWEISNDNGDLINALYTKLHP